MSRWWRAYDDAVDDPKLCLISDRAHRAWFNLCCLASRNDGLLPDMKVITLKLRMSPTKAVAVVDELRQAGLVDDDASGLRMHNWNARQFKSDVSTERVKQFRQRPRNVSSAVSVTPPETETETETEKKKDAARAAPELPLVDEEADLYRRGKQILGKEAGGLIKRLVLAKGGRVPLARAAIEQAATKQDAREYIGAIIRGNQHSEAQAVDPRL